MKLPTLQELFIIAPVATLVMAIAGVGYWLGFKSRQDFIDFLVKLKHRRRDDD